MSTKDQNIIVFGSIAGIGSSFVFILFHHIAISPIWFVLPMGVIFGMLTGASLSWSYRLIFEEINLVNSIKLTCLYLIPVILLEIFTFFFLERKYTVEETMNQDLIGTLLAISFGIVIPFSIIYGVIQGIVLGGSKEMISASVITNLVIFVGIGHNLPIFNIITIEDNWVLVKVKILIVLIFTLLITTWIITFHMILRKFD